MKKILAMAVAMTMMTTPAVCIAAENNADEAAWKDQLGVSGKLRVGMATDYPPYETYDAEGNVIGFDADISKLIADELGLELEIVAMDFDTIITAVAAGTVDMGISCFSYNEERAQSVLFTDTYMTSSQVCFASTEYGIDTMEALKDGIVGAGNGTTGMDIAEELMDTYGYKTQAGEIAIMTEAVKAGAMKAIITEKCVADSYIASEPDSFQMVAEDLTVEEIKGITNLENDALLEAVNEAIASIMADEEAYNEMILEWFQ